MRYMRQGTTCLTCNWLPLRACQQVTENEALRSKLKMQAQHTGVLVTTVASQGPEAGVSHVCSERRVGGCAMSWGKRRRSSCLSLAAHDRWLGMRSGRRPAAAPAVSLQTRRGRFSIVATGTSFERACGICGED